MRVDVWGFWVVVGMIRLSWEDVGEDCVGGSWLAILESVRLICFLVRRFMFIMKFFDENCLIRRM